MNSTLVKRPLRAKLRAAAVMLALALGSSTAPAFAANPDQAPPIPAGEGRVWFLRQLLPGQAAHAPMIYVNGAPIAVIAEGTTFYRDFPPGQYAFTVENCLQQPGTGWNLTVQADRQYGLQVTQDDNGAWDCIPQQISYLRQIQPQQVPNLFPSLTYLGAM